MFTLLVFCIISVFNFSTGFLKDRNHIDICSLRYSKKLYVEYGTSGELLADFKNGYYEVEGNSQPQGKCRVELITCPSCIIHLEVKYLNVSRSCGKSTIFSECGCDYVLVHQPPFEDDSAKQYCGNFVANNVTKLSYTSKTRVALIEFAFNSDYGHAFTLKFFAVRNRFVIEGRPTSELLNEADQLLTSPFFPQLYPSDLSNEYVVKCVSKQPCRISLLFTDFMIAESSILEFFDSNGQRLYVISGSTFRPPIIVTSGPSLTVRFYANGATDLGFKAAYYFSLDNYDKGFLKPNIDCGGQVNNLGGGITMMNMTVNETKFFDCVWIVKTSSHVLHRKTHLYVKIANFSGFAGPTELVLRKGLTSSEPVVEILKSPSSQFNSATEKEHVVSITEGFYIHLRGFFNPESRMAIVYAAFSYKDCFSGLDFFCQNSRCVSALLHCDGFDHCGDNSDESTDCSLNPKDHREFSKIPNFLFPKVDPYADFTTATMVFLFCTFGLLGIILAMSLLLYRVNLRARHQRQIQDHINTIHAILDMSGSASGETASTVDEEMIIPDEPPDYEPPPEYSEVFKYIRDVTFGDHTRSGRVKSKTGTESASSSSQPGLKMVSSDSSRSASVCRSCQTSPVKVHHDDEGTSTISMHLQNDINFEEESTTILRDQAEQSTTSNLRKYENFTRTNSFLQKNLQKYYSTFKAVRGQDLNTLLLKSNRSRSFSNSELQCDLSTLPQAVLRRSFSNLDLY